MGNVEGTDVGGGHSRNGYATGYHPGGYNGSGYQSGGYTSSTSTDAIECESQTFKSHRDEWTTRNDAYNSQGMQELQGHYNGILTDVDGANDAIDNSEITFIDLGHIDKAYTKADVADMEERRTNLVDFTSTVQEDVLARIDRPFYQKLQALSTSMKDHADLNITYLGTPFDLPYNIADPQHLCDWLWKTEFGEEDDFFFTGDATKDTLLREFTVYSDAADRYVYEDKMEDWENLSDDEKWAVKHIIEYNARHWEEYYDDDLSPLARQYRDHVERGLTGCVAVEDKAAVATSMDTQNQDDKGTRTLTLSAAGKELQKMMDSDSYAGKMITGLSSMKYELYDLADNHTPNGNKDFEFVYGTRESGVYFKVRVEHDRAATSMSLNLACAKGKDEKQTKSYQNYYDQYKDSFDAINEYVSGQSFAYLVDYKRCLNYIDKNAEMNPCLYKHQEELGMSHARLALFLCDAKNTHDMECLDETISSYGDYNRAFSVDVNLLSQDAKDNVKEYVDLVKKKADSAYNPCNAACMNELINLYSSFGSGNSKMLAGYWPLCEDALEELSTKVLYYSYQNSEDYDPAFESDLYMAEKMADGSNSIPSSVREAWFKDEKHQLAYLMVMQAKHPDLFYADWQDMSKDQHMSYGKLNIVLDEDHRNYMIGRVGEANMAEASYYIDEATGFNAEMVRISDKLKKYDDDHFFEGRKEAYESLTEEEKQKVQKYITRNCYNQVMTQEEYEALSEVSKCYIKYYENTSYIVGARHQNMDIDYAAFKRGNEEDMLYIAAKEAKNTAYVLDQSTWSDEIHTLDAAYHGATSIFKAFGDIGYIIEKKINWGDETYQEYIDYKHSYTSREYTQAEGFSEGGYLMGKIGMDLVLMWVGGELLEAAGATGAMADGIASELTPVVAQCVGDELVAYEISTKIGTTIAEISMEQVLPTVLFIIPNAAENYLNGMSFEDVMKEAGKEFGLNLLFSCGFRAGKTLLTASGRGEVARLYNLGKGARMSSQADDIARDVMYDAESEAFYEGIYASQREVIPEYEAYTQELREHIGSVPEVSREIELYKEQGEIAREAFDQAKAPVVTDADGIVSKSLSRDEARALSDQLKDQIDETPLVQRGNYRVPETEKIAGIKIYPDGSTRIDEAWKLNTDGAKAGTREMKVLKATNAEGNPTIIDRVGGENGNYFSPLRPDGEPYGLKERAIGDYLPEEKIQDNASYHQYEVQQDFTRENFEKAIRNTYDDPDVVADKMQYLNDYYKDAANIKSKDHFGDAYCDCLPNEADGVKSGVIDQMFLKDDGGAPQFITPFKADELIEMKMIKEVGRY